MDETQLVLRATNMEIRRASANPNFDDSEFVCECGLKDCDELISLTVEEFDTLRHGGWNTASQSAIAEEQAAAQLPGTGLPALEAVPRRTGSLQGISALTRESRSRFPFLFVTVLCWNPRSALVLV